MFHHLCYSTVVSLSLNYSQLLGLIVREVELKEVIEHEEYSYTRSCHFLIDLMELQFIAFGIAMQVLVELLHQIKEVSNQEC